LHQVDVEKRIDQENHYYYPIDQLLYYIVQQYLLQNLYKQEHYQEVQQIYRRIEIKAKP
jgi:hypothetical protein